MLASAHRHRSRGVAQHSFHALAEILFLDFAVIVQRNDDFARRRFTPGNVKTKVAASTIAARYGNDILVQHSSLVLPAEDAELWVIDPDAPLTVINDYEARAEINEGAKILQ
jgi:hypothetical protein